MQTYSESALKEKAKAVFGHYPKIKTLLVTSDGQCFDAVNSQSAHYHCKYNASKKVLTITTFHRAELETENEEQQEPITESELTDDLEAENKEQQESATASEQTDDLETENEEQQESMIESELIDDLETENEEQQESATASEQTDDLETENEEPQETTETTETIPEPENPLPLKKNNSKTKKS